VTASKRSIITENLLYTLRKIRSWRKITAYQLSKRANISTSSLSKLFKSDTRMARIRFIHAALLFENLSIPLETVVKAAENNDQNFWILCQPHFNGPVFTRSDAERLLNHVMIIFVELLSDKANSIENRHQLAAKLKQNSSHLYRGFPAVHRQTGEIILPLKPPIPGMENLSKMAIAFGTTLSKVILTAKKRIEASRTQEG
jgi:DNA-binding Xre family transcriptional regulator